MANFPLSEAVEQQVRHTDLSPAAAYSLGANALWAAAHQEAEDPVRLCRFSQKLLTRVAGMYPVRGQDLRIVSLMACNQLAYAPIFEQSANGQDHTEEAVSATYSGIGEMLRYMNLGIDPGDVTSPFMASIMYQRFTMRPGDRRRMAFLLSPQLREGEDPYKNLQLTPLRLWVTTPDRPPITYTADSSHMGDILRKFLHTDLPEGATRGSIRRMGRSGIHAFAMRHTVSRLTGELTAGSLTDSQLAYLNKGTDAITAEADRLAIQRAVTPESD